MGCHSAQKIENNLSSAQLFQYPKHRQLNKYSAEVYEFSIHLIRSMWKVRSCSQWRVEEKMAEKCNLFHKKIKNVIQYNKVTLRFFFCNEKYIENKYRKNVKKNIILNKFNFEKHSLSRIIADKSSSLTVLSSKLDRLKVNSK